MSSFMLGLSPRSGALLNVSCATGRNATISPPLLLTAMTGLAALGRAPAGGAPVLHLVALDPSGANFSLHGVLVPSAAPAYAPAALPFTTKGYLGVSLHMQYDDTSGLVYLQGWANPPSSIDALPSLTMLRVDPFGGGQLTVLSELTGYVVVPGGASFVDAASQTVWLSLARPRAAPSTDPAAPGQCGDPKVDFVLVPTSTKDGSVVGAPVVDQLCSGLLRRGHGRKAAALGYSPSNATRTVGTFDPSTRRFERTGDLPRRYMLGQGGVGGYSPAGVLYAHFAPVTPALEGARAEAVRSGAGLAWMGGSAPFPAPRAAAAQRVGYGMGSFRQVAVDVASGAVAGDVPACAEMGGCSRFLLF